MENWQEYVDTFEEVVGPVGLVHATGWLLGSVIVQETEPVGTTAPATPTTVVVTVVVPPRVGFGEATTEICGVCLLKLTVYCALVAGL